MGQQELDIHELYKNRIAGGSSFRTSVRSGGGVSEGVTDGEKAFMYAMAFMGFLFVLWMKREAVSETRRRVTTHLREIDRPVNEDNWVVTAGSAIGQY